VARVRALPSSGRGQPKYLKNRRGIL